MKLKLDFQKVKKAVVKNKPITIVISAIALGFLLLSLFLYLQVFHFNKPVDSIQTKEEQVQKVIGQVGALIELPKQERPTVATVSDITKLTDQPFFINAQNGDQVLIYSVAKKAILFRPSKNKIIEVASINLGLSQSTNSIKGEDQRLDPSRTLDQDKQEEYKVHVLNGTLTVGLAASTQKQIESSLPNYKVIAKGDAAKNDYSQTIVVNVSGADKTAAEKLAGLLNAKVESLPDEEIAKSGVDFLVILGSSN